MPWPPPVTMAALPSRSMVCVMTQCTQAMVAVGPPTGRFQRPHGALVGVALELVGPLVGRERLDHVLVIRHHATPTAALESVMVTWMAFPAGPSFRAETTSTGCAPPGFLSTSGNLALLAVLARTIQHIAPPLSKNPRTAWAIITGGA